MQVNIDAQQRPGDRYEVALKLKVDFKVGEAQVFILELDYAGLFLIQNVPPEQLHPLLMIECPRLIFPYVRRIVGDVTRDGGYPPLNLEQIDFLALYRAELARRQAEASDRRRRPELGVSGRARPERVFAQLGDEGGVRRGLGRGEARRQRARARRRRPGRAPAASRR